MQIPYQARPSPPQRECASALRGPTSRSQLLCAVWEIVSLPQSAPQRSSSFIRETRQHARMVGELHHSCAPSSPPLRRAYCAPSQPQLGCAEATRDHPLLHPAHARQTSPEIFHSGQYLHPRKEKRDALGGEQCQLKCRGGEMTTQATPQAAEGDRSSNIVSFLP